MDRRFFLSTAVVGGPATLATSSACGETYSQPSLARSGEVLKIAAVEILELQGSYQAEQGINNQTQVRPNDVYDSLRSPLYRDNPSGTVTVKTSALYVRIRTAAGLDGLWGPVELDAARVVQDDLRPFLIGKDALAGEILWDQMYRSSRHSRDGFFMMALSAVDNTLWDLRGRYYGVPVWRLLGGPSRQRIEYYASALGFSLEPEAVRKRSLALKEDGFRYQKWFMGYGPGSGEEGMRKNVELVKLLRETLGEDYELMFDAYSGWDQDYALEWAKRVEKYRPKWIEEATHPEKVSSFADIRRLGGVPTASGEHFYGRWEVGRYLAADAISVVQADPDWCGGASELVKIGTVASLYDIPVIPHGHGLRTAAHVIFSQSPMTFPLGEYLVTRFPAYYYFEKHPPVVERAHMTLPATPGFGVEFDDSRIHSQKVWS